MCQTLINIFLLNFQITPQVDSENPVLQMSTFGVKQPWQVWGVNISTVLPLATSQRAAGSIRIKQKSGVSQV